MAVFEKSNLKPIALKNEEIARLLKSKLQIILSKSVFVPFMYYIGKYYAIMVPVTSTIKSTF